MMKEGALKTDEEVGKLYPQVSFSKSPVQFIGKMKGYGGNGEPLIKQADTVTATRVANYINEAKADNDEDFNQAIVRYAAKSNRSVNDINERLEILRSPNFRVDRSNKMVTFSDMDMMHGLAPKQFKQIELTAYNAETANGMLLNSRSTPDLPIAFAARASMAHPALTSGVTFDSSLNIGNSKFTDGGIYSNLPVEAAFDDIKQAISEPKGGTGEDIELGKRRAQTMLFAFDEKGKSYANSFLPPSAKANNVKVSRLYQAFGVTPENRRHDVLKSHYSNKTTVFHGDLSVLGGGSDKKIVDHAKKDATFNTLIQANNRTNEPALYQVDSIEQAYGLLSGEEKELLLKDGPPKREDYSSLPWEGEGKNASYDAMTNLYNIALARRTEKEDQ